MPSSQFTTESELVQVISEDLSVSCSLYSSRGGCELPFCVGATG